MGFPSSPESRRSSRWPHKSVVCNSSSRLESIFRKHRLKQFLLVLFFKASKKQLVQSEIFWLGTRNGWHSLLLALRSGVGSDRGASSTCSSPLWALHKTDALAIHPGHLPPSVSGVSDAVLKPYALLNSCRILPSHPILDGPLRWSRMPSRGEGGLPASCVGSKYLHSPLSRVARRERPVMFWVM